MANHKKENAHISESTRFLPPEEAAKVFGYASGAAILKAFKRGQLPGKFLLRIGERKLVVDEAKLRAWISQKKA